MTMRDFLVVLDSSSKTVGPYSASLASMFQAHLTATTVVHDPTVSIAWPEASLPLLISALEDARAKARQVLDTFATETRRLGVSVETQPVEVTFGLPGRALGPLARHFDLAVIEQPNPDVSDDRDIMVESALFESGRPVLIVPYVPIAPFRLESVLVAWDGSSTAARACGDALPLLTQAKRVELIMVADEITEGESSGHRMIRHLARHNVEAHFHRLPSAGDVADTLLSHAFDASADLMVMGGYGHSRVREFILGGTTRSILGSMTLPVLMSH